jgi:hypothetical protein
VYRQFVHWLESDVTVHVVAPDRAAFDDLLKSIGHARATLKPILVGHPMTTWSRDRWLALGPAAGSSVTVLLAPRGEVAAGIWPERAGDERIAADIAKALAPAVESSRSSLYFDGGDFLADSENVFIMPRVLQRNIQITVQDRFELLTRFSDELKRNVILLDQAPDHHAAMFMTSVGNRTMVVGDPSLGKKHFPASDSHQRELLPDGADFSAQTQRLFDAVAAQSESSGYKVIRIPTVVSPDGRTFLTYVNSIIDQQGHRRIVYLPFYRGVEELNVAASKVWESLGYEVRSVDSTTTYRHFGALHCLVNVLRRG